MDWDEIGTVVDLWAEKLAALALDLRPKVAAVYTAAPLGYYADPETGAVALYLAGADPAGLRWAKQAAARAAGTGGVRAEPLTVTELAHPEARWVKLAYSPTLRRAGELLNFFPGQNPGGIPSAPSPLAAMLTSGLLGAGLGYSLGHVARHVLPEGYGRNLARSGAVLGGLAGALPGAVWAGVNRASGHGVTEGWPLRPPAGSEPGPGDLLADVPLPEPAAIYAKSAFDTFGSDPGALRVNIDAVGRTLWDSGASPALAATTMGSLYAAQQLPDPAAVPGSVTGNQLGQLALQAGGHYVQGFAVGKLLNLVAGTPLAPPQIGAGAAALGLLSAAVPQLFGGGR
jgi:hypothetical protein